MNYTCMMEFRLCGLFHCHNETSSAKDAKSNSRPQSTVGGANSHFGVIPTLIPTVGGANSHFGVIPTLIPSSHTSRAFQSLSRGSGPPMGKY